MIYKLLEQHKSLEISHLKRLIHISSNTYVRTKSKISKYIIQQSIGALRSLNSLIFKDFKYIY